MHQPRRDPYAIPQQARIGRLVDGRVHHRRVAADRATLLDALVPCETDQDPVDRFPRLGLHPFHVGLQRLVTRSLFESKAHEGAEGDGILEVKLQLAIAQTVDLLEQRDPQHLVAAQPRTTSILPPPLQEILLDELPDLRVRIQDPGRHLQLSGMLMRAPCGRQRELDFLELAHRFTPGRRFSV